MKTSPTGKRGFTMIELIVVIAIIAVLGGLIVPRLWGTGRSGELSASARGLFATAQYARNYAITHRCECKLILDPSQQSFGLAVREKQNDSPDEFRAMTTVSGRKETLPDGISFGLIKTASSLQRYEQNRDENTITFRFQGQSDSAVVQITDGSRTFSVLISPASGHCRLAEGSETQLPNERLDLDE